MLVMPLLMLLLLVVVLSQKIVALDVVGIAGVGVPIK